MTVEELFNVCCTLQNTSSRKEKENIITQYKEDNVFTYLMKFLFDNNVVTGLDMKKVNKTVNIGYYEEESGDYYLADLLDYVKAHNTGTDSDIAFINFYMWHITQDEVMIDFMKEIVTKTLRLGIDAKTVNKVYGYKLISTFDVQLGTPIEQCKLPEGTWFSLSQKLNGTRCVYRQGKLYTRQGKEYTGLQHIIDDLKVFGDSLIFDGELILKDRSAGDSASFQISTGIANSKADNKPELKLVIFDLLPVEDFDRGISVLSYADRKLLLEELRDKILTENLTNIEIVRFFYEGTDQNEIWKWLDYTEENDMEGCMLNLNTPYECKRTKNLMKVKKFFDIDLRCNNIEEGTGKNKGKLGAIICNYKDDFVKVGSGFTDEQRDYYWKNPDAIINYIVTVKYKEATKNKNGKESLQFPVFICARQDKAVADA